MSVIREDIAAWALSFAANLPLDGNTDICEVANELVAFVEKDGDRLDNLDRNKHALTVAATLVCRAGEPDVKSLINRASDLSAFLLAASRAPALGGL